MEIYITEQGAALSKSGDSLLVKKGGALLAEFELKNIESIQIFGTIQITTPLIKDLMRRGIELAYYRLTGELIGQLTPIYSKNIELRMQQHDMQRNDEFRSALASAILQARMKTCIELVEEFNRNRDELDLKSDLAALRRHLASLEEEVPSALSFMGSEGAFTRAYFGTYRKLFIEQALFGSRSRRPPLDPGNAALSFVYVLLTNRLASLLDGVGFDPYLGFYHGLQYGRVSLACDLVELIRAPFAEWNVLRFFNMSRLKSSDFLKLDGVYFKKAALKRFLALYTEEASRVRRYPYIGKGTLDDLCRYLVQWLRRCVTDGTVYPL